MTEESGMGPRPRAAKVVAGLAVIGLSGWALAAIFLGGEAPAAPRAFTSSRQCRECHAEVYAEWESSWHAAAWNDPDVRALSNDFANTDCIDCHAPRPIFETGVGNRVLPRSSRRSEGVDCIACHQLVVAGRTHVAGTIDSTRAACLPLARVELARPEFCAGCHNQHKTVDQWRESRWFEEGVDCLDCHMHYRDGDVNRGRSHACLGGHDPQLLRAAVQLRGVRADDGWIVEVENTGAGHHFPTDERSRAADLFWRPLGDAGPWRHLYRFRDPYRHEVDIPATHLAAHETRRIPLDDPEGRGRVEVALFYKLTPYWRDPTAPDPEQEATLVHRVELLP